MEAPITIQFVPYDEIDKEKWDRCICEAPNGLIYSYSFYLDNMAKHWDGLVIHEEGSYRAVMPLTWNKKYGIPYLYQPFLTAQCGVFGKNITEEEVKQFVQAIPASYKLIEISLNSGNIFSQPAPPGAGPSGFSIHRSNYVLNLNKSYDALYNNYRENIRRNIKRSKQLGCTVQKDFDVEKVIALALEQMKSYKKEASDNVYRFRKLYSYLHERKMATTYGIVSAEDQLLASCVFFFSNNRAYYILVGNHPDGRTIGASHALIDSFICDYAEKNMLLDFEGSDIRNLAFFYSSFGAKQEIFPALRINRLPFYLKWLK